MFSVSTRPFYRHQPNLRLQKNFYSRFSSAINFGLHKLKNDFRNNIYFSYTRKLCSEFELFKVSNFMKVHSSKILKTCSEQCEFITAHRIRRNQQIISLYKKWWGGSKFSAFLQTLAINVLKRRKYLFTACFTPVFQWDNQRIPEKEILNLENEIENAKSLLNEHKNDDAFNENAYESENNCECDHCRNLLGDDWNLFFSNESFKIWRKEHVNYIGQGLYVYKVYGCFDDVTAKDFFQVQIDPEYRKEWDTNSIQLYLVDSDPESNSDVLYWEFLFPRMFYNRDYVCNRRFRIDNDKKTMIIVNKSVDHPLCPENPRIYRVSEYWSHTIIKSTDDFDKPGVEFTITYFDNPGLSVPSYVSAWYTVPGMPDYLMKQKKAALNLATRNSKNLENEILTNQEYFAESKLKKEENVSKAESGSFSQQPSDKHIMLL